MLWTVTLTLAEGFLTTLEIFLLTLVFALPLGLVVAFGLMNKWAPLKRARSLPRAVRNFAPISAICKFVVWIFRGTPLMLQIIIVFYGPGLLWDAAMLPRMTAVLIAFIINYACYFSEIYRGGIEAIPKGQHEAAQVLGMSKTGAFFKVVLMQVVKRILPSMGNEVITLAKDTALANCIAIKEITMAAKEFIATDGLLWPLFYSGAFYLIFCGLLTVLLGRAEKKLGYFKV